MALRSPSPRMGARWTREWQWGTGALAAAGLLHCSGDSCCHGSNRPWPGFMTHSCSGGNASRFVQLPWIGMLPGSRMGTADNTPGVSSCLCCSWMGWGHSANSGPTGPMCLPASVLLLLARGSGSANNQFPTLQEFNPVLSRLLSVLSKDL